MYEMYEMPRLKVKFERGSTFIFTRDLSYSASVLFTREKFTRVSAYATVEIHLKSAILYRLKITGS